MPNPDASSMSSSVKVKKQQLQLLAFLAIAGMVGVFQARLSFRISQWNRTQREKLRTGGNENDALAPMSTVRAMPNSVSHLDSISRMTLESAEDKNPSFSSKARLFFIVGLEGTGHHLLAKIARNSPVITRAARLEIHPKETQELVLNLYHHNMGGLFNIHCAQNIAPGISQDHIPRGRRKGKKKKIKQAKIEARRKLMGTSKTIKGDTKAHQNKRRRLLQDEQVEYEEGNEPQNLSEDSYVDKEDTTTVETPYGNMLSSKIPRIPKRFRKATKKQGFNPFDELIVEVDSVDMYFDRVVQAMKRIEDKAVPPKNFPYLSVPINVWESNEFFGAGMMSYPNFRGDCRNVNYPQLDLLYQACNAAQVDCQHVYIYRNPFSIINSTCNKRPFNPTILGAIQTYTTMLRIIFSQLQTYPTRIAGCYSLLDDNDWMDSVGTLFQWHNRTGYEETMERIVHSKQTNMTQEERDAIVPPRYHMYMDSFLQLHETVIGLCKRQYEEVQQTI